MPTDDNGDYFDVFDAILSVEETQNILTGLDEVEIKRLVTCGYLDGEVVGGVLLISTVSVMEYLNGEGECEEDEDDDTTLPTTTETPKTN